MPESAPPEFEHVTVTVEGTRANVLLDQPDKLNPLSTQTLLDLEAAARWIDSRPDLRIAVVSGAGRVFSAGADLSAFTEEPPAAVGPRGGGEAGRRMADAIEAMRVPAIAQLHGWCVGGGLVVAAACDLRVAAEGTMFSIPEVDLGIPLAWGGIPRLVREIGPALTKELVMTCRPFTAEEALGAGFLNRIVPTDALASTVDELVEAVSSRPAYAIQSTKAATNAVTSQMVGTGRAFSDTDALAAGLRDPEGRASAAAYLAKVTGKSS